MGIDTMGRVLVSAKIESMEDLFEVWKGMRAKEQVRHVEVDDALVDTGATNVCLPKRMIQQLGLVPLRSRSARTSAGTVMLNVYGAVRLNIQGRDCTIDVTEIPDDCPVLIGQVALELLDFIVDPKGQRLIGNPDHGGEHMMDLF